MVDVLAANVGGGFPLYGFFAILLGPVLWAVGFVVLYWVIRLAVRHGIRDANQRR